MSDSNLIKTIHSHLTSPGANRDSLRHLLIEQEGMAADAAGKLANAVCRKMNDERFPPVSELELMLTEDCNQRCDYCFIEGKNTENRMGWTVAKRAVDFLFAGSRKSPRLKILFFGGEPLLAFGLIEKITLYAEEKGQKSGQAVAFDMTTNGTLFSEDRGAFMAQHGIKFLLSIDGDRDTHDRHRRRPDGKSSYGEIVRNLGVMKRHQPWLGARMTVHPDTVSRIVANVVHLAESGFNQFLIGPATGLDWSDRDLDTYRDQMIGVARWLKEERDRGRHIRVTTLEENLEMLGGKEPHWGCRAGRQSVTVTARGGIFPCSKMLGVDRLEGIYPLGSVDEGITEIHNRLLLCGMVPVVRDPCRRCGSAGYCMGGCFATNYQATGSIFEPDPFECRLKERTIEILREAEKILGAEYFKKIQNRNREDGKQRKELESQRDSIQ